eukprot:Tbor_TRINITY_DN3744_c0_g1::TRINITY_DN3744_c0_g1_i2::g.2507::m.2507
MLRSFPVCLSSAFHQPRQFTHTSLQLIKYHLAHKNAMQERNIEIAKEIEDAYHEELHKFRPLFSLTNTELPSAKPYHTRVFRSLRYFGLHEDPLTVRLEALLGKRSMRRESKLSVFKTGDRDIAKVIKEGMGNKPSASPSIEALTRDDLRLNRMRDISLEFTVDERPVPAAGEKALQHVSKERNALRRPDRYRGHWVLRDEEIAITREGRKEDPW